MRKRRLLALGAAMLVAIAACSSGGSKPEVRIGSDNFYESKLMAELYAQVLEANDYAVTRQFGLGSRPDRVPTFEAGQIDLVPEYVGSGLGFYEPSKVTSDGEANRTALAAILAGKGAQVFAITPGEDTNAAAVRQDTADELGLVKMSDLAAVQDQLAWGLTPECDANPLCRGALEAYGITYPPAERESLAACDVPMAEALDGKAIDVAWLCSTQPAIAQFGFVVLEDDLGIQPAENIAPLVRDDYLAKLDDAAAFQGLLDDLSAKITTEVLIDLGVKIAVEQEDIPDVAKAWLEENGFLE